MDKEKLPENRLPNILTTVRLDLNFVHVPTETKIAMPTLHFLVQKAKKGKEYVVICLEFGIERQAKEMHEAFIAATDSARDYFKISTLENGADFVLDSLQYDMGPELWAAYRVFEARKKYNQLKALELVQKGEDASECLAKIRLSNESDTTDVENELVQGLRDALQNREHKINDLKTEIAKLQFGIEKSEELVTHETIR